MRVVAGIDVGLKRIGLALAFNDIILPQNAIIRKNRVQAAREVDKFLIDNSVELLVVGVPKGGFNDMEVRIKHFINLLSFDKKIEFVDESFSSKEASEFGVVNHRKKDGKLDSLSAMIILKRYLKIA